MQPRGVAAVPSNAVVCRDPARALESSGPHPVLRPTLRPMTEERLDSWKEIAAYLRRDVTTVQRWEKREGMPVHRHQHDRIGSVYTYRHELDAWSEQRRSSPPESTDPSVAGEVESAAFDSKPLAHERWLWFGFTVSALVAIGVIAWLISRSGATGDVFSGARFLPLTNSGGISNAAALSRDGRYVAFLSDRDGRMDVWVTQIGTGQFYNRTADAPRELVNAAIRTVGFSPDDSLVTFWVRHIDPAGTARVDIWAAPVLGGSPKPYLEGAAEYDWSPDNTQLVYHTAADGDPMFVRRATETPPGHPLFTAPDAGHSHFTTWSPDGRWIYFVQGCPRRWISGGSRPGGSAERITRRRLPWRIRCSWRADAVVPRHRWGWLRPAGVRHRRRGSAAPRLDTGLDRYSSLAASADGRRLVATLARPRGTLWRVAVGGAPVDASVASHVSLTTGTGVAPRLGPGYLLYVSSKGTSDGIWKLTEGAATELWSAPEARIVGGPEIAPAGDRMAFSVEQGGRTLLYVVNAERDQRARRDGIARAARRAAWASTGVGDRRAAAASRPRLFRVALDGAVAAGARILRGPYLVAGRGLPRLLWTGRRDEVRGEGGERDGRASSVSGPDALARSEACALSRRRARAGGDARRNPHKNLWAIDLAPGASGS